MISTQDPPIAPFFKQMISLSNEKPLAKGSIEEASSEFFDGAMISEALKPATNSCEQGHHHLQCRER